MKTYEGMKIFHQWIGRLCLIIMACMPICSHAAEPISTEAQTVSATQELTTGWGFTVQYPATWSEAPQRYSNMIELVNVPPDRLSQVQPTARVGITSDQLESHAAALREIQDISNGLGAPQTSFIEIAGWPAFQHKWLTKREQPDHGPKNPDPLVIRISTMIAAGARLIRIEAWLPSDSPEEMIEEVKTIGRSVKLEGGNVSLEGGIDLLPLVDASPLPAAGNPDGAFSAELTGSTETLSSNVVTTLQLTGATNSIDLLPGFEQQIFPNRNGEVEITASPDGQFIVIGRQSWISSSQDGGQNFTNGGRIPFSNGDPSLAYGLSGNFYYAGIDENDGGGFPNGPGTGSGMCPGPDGTSAFGYSCTNIAISTDNGVSFPTASIVTAVACPQADDLDGMGGLSPAAGACFPDQEHIAADRFNPGSGGDQVYSTWRSFPGGVASLVCSQDSGQTWTAPLVVEADGRFPRISVGQDGFVYIAYYASGNYRIAKYSSCANGLALQFRRTVFSQNPIGCPFVGHDRCDQNPSSQMVAVDDTNPNHIYYSYAETAGSADNDRIIVQDSLDGGDTWDATRRVRINANIPGKRIMPWICTTGGEAFVTWYDRRSAPLNANDRTDFYGGSAYLDQNGALIAGPDFKINEASDDWCNSGWPCSTRSMASAEQCSVQPQLAGRCRANCSNPATTDSAVPCDFSDGCAGLPGANPGEVCCTGNGCPKYGDYNGNACVAGRLLAAWASATPAPYIPPPGGSPPPIGLLYSEILVGDVPQIQVPSAVTIDQICGNEVGRGTLQVCNTGNDILEVYSVTSSNPVFTVTTPAGEGYPVRISPDFCFPFEVVFTPAGTGAETSTLTISSNDPSYPSVAVMATGSVGVQDIQVTIANSGSFGKVCKQDHTDLNLTLLNQGQCDLTISNIQVIPDPGSFELPADLQLPLVLSPDANFTVPVRFSPDECSDVPEMRTIRLTSDDPDESVVNVEISGVSPCPNLVIDPADVTGMYAFPTTVADSSGTLGCYSERTVTLRNNGECPLTIEAITAAGLSGDPADYAVTEPSVFPLILPSGEETLGVTVRFTPQFDADPLAPSEVTGSLTVVSDDPDGVGHAGLCGESAAQSGVRVLVTDISTGVPVNVDQVDTIVIQSKGINRPSPIRLQYRDQSLSSATICGNDIYYHVDQETLPSTDTTGANPTSSYLTKAMEGNLQVSESFGLDQCEFKEFQLELQDSDSLPCLLLPKDSPCTTDGECCSGRCKGPIGGKTCK